MKSFEDNYQKKRPIGWTHFKTRWLDKNHNRIKYIYMI